MKKLFKRLQSVHPEPKWLVAILNLKNIHANSILEIFINTFYSYIYVQL